MKKLVIVTTSWDDGHKLDLKLAKLLAIYNIPATFYVSPNDKEFIASELLTKKDIKLLSNDFEIGSHTMTHQMLTNISEKVTIGEMIVSKKYLEDLVNKKISSFSYPYGKYNNKIMDMARYAGYTYARTVRQISTKYSEDALQSNTTILAAPLTLKGWLEDIKYSLFGEVKIFPRLLKRDWEIVAKKLFDYVLTYGGVFHLWGHSWEVEKNNEWDKLERVLEYISNKQEIKYLTNGESITLNLRGETK